MTDHPSALVTVPVDTFNGDNAALVASISALLENPDTSLSARVPGMAKQLLASAAARLAAAPAVPQAAGAGEIDLYDDKVQAGIAWTMRQWGETLGLKTWTQGDGSESVEGDVGAEIHTILVDAGLRDPETNEMAALRTPSREPEGGAVHYGDPCVKCGIGHDDVPQGPCRGDGITISRERANALLGYLKNGRGPAGWPTTLWCEVQAFIKNIETALAAREEAPAEAGEDERLTPDEAWSDLLEKDDRTSPEDQPDMLLIAWDELADYMVRAQPQAREDAQPVGEIVLSNKFGSGVSWLDGKIPPLGSKLYTRPSLDALRLAVGALEGISEVAHITRAHLIARHTLAALRTEQKAK